MARRSLATNRPKEPMENWKRALIAGSAAVSAICFIKGKRGGGMLFAGVSLATLASHYPEGMRKVRAQLPMYLDRGLTVLEVASRIGERLGEAAERRDDWVERLLAR